MNSLEFWSPDRKFGLLISQELVTEILTICARKCPDETGGILLGKYSTQLDCAVVTIATKAPPDSRSGRTWFKRGVQGLQSLLEKLWIKNRQYYLGEWHFHPYAAPDPSGTDKMQVQEIAESQQYSCPEPILLIVGGDPRGKWEARAFVFRKQQIPIELTAIFS